MKRKVPVVVMISLMFLALFVTTVNAEAILEEDVEMATLDGFGTIMGYVTRIGILGPAGVRNAKVTAESSFGTYNTKTNWGGYYILMGLGLSKKGWADYEVTVNINGYEITKEVRVYESPVWLNFSLPPGFDSYSVIERSSVSQNSLTLYK